MLLMLSCGNKELYKDASQTIDARVDDLVKRMTLDEKLTILSGDTSGFDTKAIPRLGIPAIHLTDGPIGVRWNNATSFPAAIAYAASWDTMLVKELAKAMAIETKAKGRDYLLGPCVCINRMPLGGRNFESYGEDPYLTSRMAVNWVKGLQGENVMGSVKHFAMNDQEWERNNYDVVADERTMREMHLPMFEAAVKEGGVWSVMSAYNIVNGHHCSENQHLLTDILKNDWGFKGFVVSDWVSVYSTVNAANAGLDLEMPLPVYFNVDSLKDAMDADKISEQVIDDKVKRILRAAFSIGLFDSTKTPDTSVFFADEHKKLVLKAGQEAITLLKNDNNILPLDIDNIKTIAVIGPNASKTRVGGGGSSHVDPYYSVSPLEGITKRAGEKIKVLFSQGDDINNMDAYKTITTDFFLTPDKKENGLKAEYFKNMNLEGDPSYIKTVKTIDFDFGDNAPVSEVDKDRFSVRFSGYIRVPATDDYTLCTYSDDGVRLYIDDKLVIENWTDHGPTPDLYTKKFVVGKVYKLRLDFYDNMQGSVIKLGLAKASDLDKQIQDAVETAKKADVALIFGGSADNIESEGVDMVSMDMPYRQKQLIEEVSKVNKNTVVVLNGGTPLNLDWLPKVKGLLLMYYLGQETGNAIASVLFGDVNPAGKLPYSYIKDLSQSPGMKEYKDKSLKVHYDEGIFLGYRYLDKNKLEPQFPFGFGLSYTTFEYSNLKIEQKGTESYSVTFDVKNTGKVAGNEVAQLYLSDKECSVPRPLKELKDFTRVSLNPGEIKTVAMKLAHRDFAFWDVNTNNWKVEPGAFEVLVGASSRDIKLKQEIDLK